MSPESGKMNRGYKNVCLAVCTVNSRCIIVYQIMVFFFDDVITKLGCGFITSITAKQIPFKSGMRWQYFYRFLQMLLFVHLYLFSLCLEWLLNNFRLFSCFFNSIYFLRNPSRKRDSSKLDIHCKKLFIILI